MKRITKNLGSIFTAIFISGFSFGSSLVEDAGTVDGGGGGVLPIRPVSKEDVVNTLINNRQSIRVALKSLEYRYQLNKLQNKSYASKLFAGERTIWQVFEATDVDYQMDAPCFNAFDQPVDASIYSKIKNHVCISPYSLAPKLTKSNVREEIIALVLHEVGHLLALSEAEAIEFQEDILDFMIEYGAKFIKRHADNQNNYSRRITDDLQRLNNRIDGLIESNDLEPIRKTLGWLANMFWNNHERRYLWSEATIHTLEEVEFYDYHVTILEVALDYFVGDEFDHRVFSGKDSISFQEYKKFKSERLRFDSIGNLMIEKPVNLSDVRTIVATANEYFKRYHSSTLAHGVSGARTEYLVPKRRIINPSSWTNFSGYYEVTKYKCDGAFDYYHDEIQGFKLSDPGNGKVKVTQFNPSIISRSSVNGFMPYIDVFTTSKSDGITEFITGDSKQVSYFKRYIEDWANNFYVHHLTVKFFKKDDHHFHLVRDFYQQHWDREVQVFTTKVGFCEYDLVAK